MRSRTRRPRRRHQVRRAHGALPRPPGRGLRRLHHLAPPRPAPRRALRPARDLGRGRLRGTHPFADGTVSFYGAAVAPAGEHAPKGEKAALLRRFGDGHDPIPAIIDAAVPDEILRHEVHHVAEPLPAFHRGRVALLGDAAHAMPPTLGQGGNHAIEDAVVLAHHADPAQPDALGLAAYTAARRPRTTAIARKAVAVGRVNMLGNRPAMALRNPLIAALDKTGPAVMLRGFDEIADRRPPQRPYAAQTQRA